MKRVILSNVIENQSELPFYEKVLLKVGNYLKNNGRADFAEIIKFVEGGDRRTLRLLNEMVLGGLIKFKDGYFYPVEKKRYKLTNKDVACPKCQGKIINPSSNHFLRIKKMMRRVYNVRPVPTFIFDQRPVTLETTIRRAFYLVWRGDIQSKKIALIGDDDLTSLALGFLNLAREIVVFEIDKRFVQFLRKQAAKYHLRVKVVEMDVLSGIPVKYKNKFDVFLADPTPMAVPFTAFVNTGIRLLKKGEGRTGYLSFLPSCMEKSIKLQKILTQMNLIITDSIPFFTEYEVIKKTYSKKDFELLKQYARTNPRTAFYEYLVRVETTQKTKTKILNATTKDILGRATKRVLRDLRKDPAIDSDRLAKNYLIKTARRVIKTQNKKLKF